MVTTDKQGNRVPLVLIVDDNEENIGLIGQLLSREIGCDIAIASNGASAMKMALKAIPDLILLDVMMPDINGYEVCKRLKEQPGFERIPVIFLTAKVEEDDIAEGFYCGAVDYITKPVKHAELLARVKTHLYLKTYENTIREQLSELRQLNRVLCHDLLNPINSIIGAFELIKMNLESDNEETRIMSGIIDRSLDNTISLINSIRKAYSIGEGKSMLEIKNHSLSALLQESLTILNDRIQEKEIAIQLRIPKTIRIRVDWLSCVNSVINNLITNAIKFSHRGSVIWIEANDIGETVIVRIKDQGIGIPPGILAKLFDMTEQTNRAGTEGESGTGYGMPLVKKYVEAYGGDIQVESTEKGAGSDDLGTVVMLTLLKGTP